jgi:hypothetical protein
MTFCTFVTYESSFESLVHEGCDHVSYLTSSDFSTSESLYTEVSDDAGAAADEMLDCMWVPFGSEVARMRFVAELEWVGALTMFLVHFLGCILIFCRKGWHVRKRARPRSQAMQRLRNRRPQRQTPLQPRRCNCPKCLLRPKGLVPRSLRLTPPKPLGRCKFILVEVLLFEFYGCRASYFCFWNNAFA